jgi:hypothetical protein
MIGFERDRGVGEQAEKVRQEAVFTYHEFKTGLRSFRSIINGLKR